MVTLTPLGICAGRSVGTGVSAGRSTGAGVAVAVPVAVAMAVGVPAPAVDVAVDDGVDVAVGNGVEVALDDGVDVAVGNGVEVALDDGVDVAVGDGVDVAVGDGVDVGVGVCVAVAGGCTSTAPMSQAVGGQMFEQIMGQKPPVDAIFFCNDDLAQGALLAAWRLRIAVPRRVAIAGFNDLTGSAQMVPPLTTVRTPRAQIGAIGFEMTTSH